LLVCVCLGGIPLDFRWQAGAFDSQCGTELLLFCLRKLWFIRPWKHIAKQLVLFLLTRGNRRLHVAGERMHRLHDTVVAPIMPENYTSALAEKSRD
jgi:uncharacterized protein involved in response to NO